MVTLRALNEMIQIPKAERVIGMIDCKQGVEAAKARRVVDAIATDIEGADRMLTNIKAEMQRRGDLILKCPDPNKYWDSKIYPNGQTPSIICVIDELAVIASPIKGDKDLEEIRKHAFAMFTDLLFLARFAGISVIVCIQRADSALLSGFAKNNLQVRIVGRLASKVDSEVCLGTGTAEFADASQLTDHWFILSSEGQGYKRFKTPMKPGDEDLKAVFLNPRFYAPEGRGDWLTAEPGTPESIAPWWNGDGSLKDNYMFDLESDHEPEPSPVPDPEFFGASSQPSSDFYDEDDDRDSEPEVEMSVDDLADAMSNPDAVYQQFGQHEQASRQPRRQGERQARRPVQRPVPQYDPVFGDGFLPAHDSQDRKRDQSSSPSPIKDGVDYLESIGLKFEEFTEEELARPQGKGQPIQSRRRGNQPRRQAKQSQQGDMTRPAHLNRGNRKTRQAGRGSESSSPDLQVEYRQARRCNPEGEAIKNAAPLFEIDEKGLEDDVMVGFEEIAEQVESIPLNEAEEIGGVDTERRRRRGRNKKGQKAERQAKTEADDDDWFSRI